MKFSDYMKQNAPTEEELKAAEEERTRELERQEADRREREALEQERKRKAKELPSEKERAIAARFYRDMQRDLIEGKAPSLLLLTAIKSLAIMFRTSKEDLDKMIERLEVIQGHTFKDIALTGTELAEVENRLRQLEEAMQDSGTTYREKQILRQSIKANQKRLKALQEEANKAEEPLFLD